MDEKRFAYMTGGLVAICAVGMMAGIYIFEAGLSLAIAAWLGLFLVYTMSPHWLKLTITWTPVRWCVDIGITVATPMIMGRTVTGIFAGIILGIMTTLSLKFEWMRLRKMFTWQRSKTLA